MLTAVTAVRTKGSLAGVNILLLAIVFIALMIFGSSVTIYQSWLIITFLIVWQGFAVFAMFNLPSMDSLQKEEGEVTPVAKIKKRGIK